MLTKKTKAFIREATQYKGKALGPRDLCCELVTMVNNFNSLNLSK